MPKTPARLPFTKARCEIEKMDVFWPVASVSMTFPLQQAQLWCREKHQKHAALACVWRGQQRGAKTQVDRCRCSAFPWSKSQNREAHNDARCHVEGVVADSSRRLEAILRFLS